LGEEKKYVTVIFSFFLIFVHFLVKLCRCYVALEYLLNLSTVIQRTADIGSKFHCAMVRG